MSHLSNSSLRVVMVLAVGAALHTCPGSGWLPVAAAQSSLPGAVWFALGPGGSDVISHQVVRTKDDRVYIFTSRQSETTLRVYRTTAPGLPGSAAAFAAPITQTAPALPISLDAVYDGNTIVHVLINTQAGQIIDYPFDLSSDSFRSPTTLAVDGGTVNSVVYIGSIGVSAMMDTAGQFHVAYWSGADHIRHGLFTYNGSTNAVTQVGGWTQVDSSGAASHPAVAVSPLDNSLTVAWISEADAPPRIRARTRSSGGAWGSVQSVSSAPVWVCTRGDQDCNGINIDQGPSLVIDASGTRHLAYIEDIGAVADYGRIHYATNSGSGWSDQTLSAFSHTPALTLDAADTPYIVGHGHPLSPSCKSMDDMCVIRKNSNGTWGNPQLFAPHPPGSSFDNATSVKWSVVGFNRPDAIEFAFYETPYSATTLYYGRFGGLRAQHDYDGDGKADVGVFRPSNSAWYIVGSATGTATGWLWGTNGDVPVPADYDGDARTDVAVFRPGNGTWYIARSSGGSVGMPWGQAGDVPAPGDYDGDGKADVTVFRPSANAWYIIRSSTGTSSGVVWGDSGDIPVPADYDGDGRTDVAVFRGTTHAWYIVKSSTGTAIGFLWGDTGDTPVVADYDGDGKADVGVFRGSVHAWYIIYSSTNTGAGFTWGDTGDVPVSGDYDGDRKADVTVFRPGTGTWYILKSTGGATGLVWGAAGDLPV